MKRLAAFLIITTLLFQFEVANCQDFTSIDQQIESALKKSGTPGAVFIVVRDGKIIHARGYGYADLESHLSATPETVWPIASITKVLTAIGTMQLVESGKISLTEDVNKYLKRAHIPDAFSKPITVADLLRHTSGLDELPGRRFERASDVPPFDAFLSTHLVRYRAPGEVTSYSSYGMSLAGLLIEDVSGINYSNYIDTHIFKPLEMKSARIMTKAGDEKNLVIPYEIDDGKARRMNYEWYATPPVASAVVSANDMGKLLIDLTSDKPKLLSRAALLQMFSTQATLNPSVPGWGYGFQLDEFNGNKIAEHGGDIGGFAGLLSIVPERRLGMFIMHHGEGSSIRFDVRKTSLEKFFPGDASIPTAIKNVDLKSYAGKYRASFVCHTCSDPPEVPEFEVTINQDNTLQLWGSRWLPIGKDLFARDDGRDRLAFVRDTKGKVVALSGGSWRVGERLN